MQSLSFILGLIASAAAVWWVTQVITSRKHAGRVHDLESKVRATESEAFHLKEQVGTLRGEVVALQKTLSDERVSKQEALVALSGAFQKGLIGIAVAAFITGGALSGSMAWLASSWKTQMKLSMEMTQEKVQFEITKLKLELLEKQYGKSEGEREQFRTAWHEEQILRVAAETRLEVLGANFPVPEKFGGISLEDLDLREKTVKKAASEKVLSFIRGATLRP